MKTTLITGITGQDGSYLAEFLLSEGYNVVGMHRRSSVNNFDNILRIKDKITLVCGELTDSFSLNEVVRNVRPDEVYNLAAQSDVKISESQPYFTWEANAAGVVRLLEAIKKFAPKAKFYQASTSEMFGNSLQPQSETTIFAPESPYGDAKLWAHQHLEIYRKEGIFAVGGILFNHESPRRGLNFVTRKITHNLARINLGLAEKFELGNLDSKRDWGFAGDYVKAMHLMLQQNVAQDFVIATGEPRTVREFVKAAGEALGMSLEFKGSGVDEKVFWNGKEIISVNPLFFRRQEVNYLCGNASKAKRELNWSPETGFYKLVEMMAKSDLQLLSERQKTTY